MAPATRSRGCDEAVRHRFDNDSQTTVDCFWLDYEGNEVRYGTVHPGLSHLQSAYYCREGAVPRGGLRSKQFLCNKHQGARVYAIICDALEGLQSPDII